MNIKIESIRFIGIMTWTFFVVMALNLNQNSFTIGLIQLLLIVLSAYFVFILPTELYEKEKQK